MNQPLSVSGIIPSKSGPEHQTSSDTSINNTQFQSDIKSMTDEMTSVRKALSDIRTHFEEVR
jgi:hypothetical protein